jgi:hypothetical protein
MPSSHFNRRNESRTLRPPVPTPSRSAKLPRLLAQLGDFNALGENERKDLMTKSAPASSPGRYNTRHGATPNASQHSSSTPKPRQWLKCNTTQTTPADSSSPVSTISSPTKRGKSPTGSILPSNSNTSLASLNQRKK